MTWQHDPWTQDDSVLDGLPYTVEPPAPYSISGVKTVWHWSRKVLDGLPYTVAPPERWGFKAIYVGDTRVRAVYRGETLVWAVGMAWRQFASLNDYLDYYYDPARTSVWERPGFAAYISGLWGIQTALRYVTPTVETSHLWCYTGKYLHGGKVGYGTTFGYYDIKELDTIPLVRAQHFTVTARIAPDDHVTLPWSFDTRASLENGYWWKIQRGRRLQGALTYSTTGILTDTTYEYATPSQVWIGFYGSQTIPTIEAGAFSDYADALLGALTFVTAPNATVTRAAFADYIRNDYNAFYLRQYPALADVIFVPPQITLGTWDDLAALTWDDASAYTWNEIGGN